MGDVESKFPTRVKTPDVLIWGLLEEIQVLESIYIEELDVKRNDMDEVSQIILQLHPSTGEDLNQRYVCMTLILDLSPHYPDVPPDFTIRNPRGISEEELLSLREDMHKLCEERKGGPVLFELIELAKDSLTAGNIPHCLCMICLEHFSEGEKFTKTECYHYFHEGCLSRYVHHILTQTPEIVPAHAMPDPEKNKLVCPVCREEIKYELDDFEIVPAEDNFEYNPTSEMRDLQNKMAEILERQKAIGGIIDVEAEKNKYLVKHDDVVLLSLPKPKENKDPKRKSSGRRYEKIELDLTKNNLDDGKPGNDKANKNTEKRPYGTVKGRGFRFNENPPRQSSRGEKGKGGRKEKEDFRDNLSDGYYSDDCDEIEHNKGAKNNSKGDGRTFNNDRQSYHRERDKDTYKDRRNMNVKHKETDKNSSVRNRDDEREHKVKQIESTDNKVSIEDEIESNDNNKKSENNSQSNESEKKIVQQEPNTNCEIEDNLKSVDAVEQKKDESTSVTKEKENIRKEINKTENDEKSKFEFKDYKRGGFSRPHSGNKDRRTENKNEMDVRKNNKGGFGKQPSQKNDKDDMNEMKDGTYNRKGGFEKPNGSKVKSNERVDEKESANKSEGFNRKTDERYNKTNNQASEKSHENRQNQGGRSFKPSGKNYDRQSSGESRVSDQSKPYEKRGGFGHPERKNYNRQSSEKEDKDDVHETKQNKRVHSGGFGRPPAKNKPEDWESEISNDIPRNKDILEPVKAQVDDPKQTIETEKQDSDCKHDEMNETKQGQNQLKTERRDNREYPDRRNRYEKCYGDSDRHIRAGGNKNYRNKQQKDWRAHEDNTIDSNVYRRDSRKYERNEKDLNINISDFDKSDLNKNNNARTDDNSHKSEDTDRKHEKDGESDHAALVTISKSAHSSWKKDGRKEVGRQEKESKHTDMKSGKIYENNHEESRQHNNKWGDEKHFDRHQKDRRYNHDGRKEVYHKGNVVNKFDERTSSAGNSRAKSERKYSDSEWQERDREYHHGNKEHHKVSDGKYSEPRQGNQQERDREYHHGNKVHHKVSDGKYSEPRQGNQQERDREYHHGNKVHHKVSDGKYSEPRQGNQRPNRRFYDSHHNHEHDGHDSWREERDNKHHKEGPNLSKKQYNKTITSSHSFKDSPKGSGEVVEDIDNVERKFSELDMTESQSEKGHVDKDDRRNHDDKDVKREKDKAIQSGSKSKQFEETRNIDVSRTNKDLKEDSHKSGGPPGFALSPPPGFQSTEVIEGEGKPCVQPPPGF